MRKIIGVTVIVAIFFVGWMVGASETSVQAQTAVGPPDTLLLPCHFEIVADIGSYNLGTQSILLDQCTGETWRFYGGTDGTANWYAVGRN